MRETHHDRGQGIEALRNAFSELQLFLREHGDKCDYADTHSVDSAKYSNSSNVPTFQQLAGLGLHSFMTEMPAV